MAQVALHGLDVIPGADGGYGIAVSEIVKTGIRAANGGHSFLEVFVYCVDSQMSAQLIGENKAGIFPKRASPETLLCLFCPVGAQDLQDPGSRGYGAGFIVFQRGKDICPVFLFLPLELLTDKDSPPLKSPRNPRSSQAPRPPGGR